MRAWVRGEPPLLELRKNRRLKRGDVVSRLTELLGLAPERETKVAGYYHRLEGGLLEPRAVDARVWDALAQLFGTDVRALARWRPAPLDAKFAYLRADASVQTRYVPAEPMLEEDEIDRLFLSGS